MVGDDLMPEEEREEEEKVQGEQDSATTEPKKVQASPEDELKAYISVYIDSYMDYVEELNLDQEDFPLFYTYYPFDVSGYILPDKSSCILFRGLAAATLIDVKKVDFNAIDNEIIKRKYDHICCYPPSHSYTKEEAVKKARKDVEQDIERTRLLKNVDAEGAEKDYNLKSIRLLSVVVPWIGTRKEGKGKLKIPSQTEASKFTSENLRIKAGEDFSGYSKRLKNLEKNLFEGEAPAPPKPSEEPPPPAPAIAATPVPTQIPVPSPGAPANISIEIKQPEVMDKGETLEEKRELDMLRLKKTLYIQTTDLEDLKRKVIEINNKLGNMEQMRQTVFRMNRKVYDTDARTTSMEKSNREMMRKVAEMSAEQREENKKMRRFIMERTKKVRNQALTVAGIALIIALVSLPLLVMLLMKFWGEIKTMLGL
jgi:hypothetical protein